MFLMPFLKTQTSPQTVCCLHAAHFSPSQGKLKPCEDCRFAKMQKSKYIVYSERKLHSFVMAQMEKTK